MKEGPQCQSQNFLAMCEKIIINFFGYRNPLGWNNLTSLGFDVDSSARFERVTQNYLKEMSTGTNDI